MKKVLIASIILMSLSQVHFPQDIDPNPQPFDLTGIIEKQQVEKMASIPIDQNEQYVAYKLSQLISNDVFGYFDIEDKFPTPLQVKNFKKSEEYNSLLNSMKEQREKLPELEFKLNIDQALSRYDMKRGGFTVDFSFTDNPVLNDDYTCNIKMCNPRGQCARQECEGNRRTSFPSANLGFLFYEIAGKNNKKVAVPWFIKVDETNASTVETTNAKARIIFKVGKLQTKMHRTNKAESLKLPNGYSISAKETHNMKLPLFEAKIIRIEFIDSTGAVVASTVK